MSKKKYKSCALDDIFCVSSKKYGYHDRYRSCSMFSTKSTKPLTSVIKLLACSNQNCDKEESNPKEFQVCANCLTVYCSRECQLSDWPNNKFFCKSEQAYFSHL